MNEQELTTLLAKLLTVKKEHEYVEFKGSNFKPEDIGERISALANGAALFGQSYGYLVFGIEDGTQKVIGTVFKPKQQKIGNNELENWLAQMLTPHIDFRIYEFNFQSKPIVLFHIPAAFDQPIKFQNNAFIRVGGITRNLRDFPDKERKLWQRPSSEFEREIAMHRVSASDVVALLDTQAFFDLLVKSPYPTTQDGVIDK